MKLVRPDELAAEAAYKGVPFWGAVALWIVGLTCIYFFVFA